MYTHIALKTKKGFRVFKAMKKSCLPQSDAYSYALKTKKWFRVFKAMKKILVATE
jgi:hypothetical protein